MEEKKRHPSLPANYVTLAQLQERWLQQQQQPHAQQHQEKKGLEQYQGDLHQSHATASRSFSGKQNPDNRNHNQQKNRRDSEGIDRDKFVNLEGEGSMQWKGKVKSKSKQARVDERGTKFEEENEEKEKEEVKQESHQQRRVTPGRAFARKQSRVNSGYHWKIRGDLGTNAEKQRNDADIGIGSGNADLESKGPGELKKNEEAKPKPKVYEGGIRTEEKKEKEKEKEKEDEEVKQEQPKHHRNGRLNGGKIRADFRTNAEKQCDNAGTGDGESKLHATAKPKPLVEESKTEMEGENKKKQREEVSSNTDKEKAKIIESQSNEDKSGGCGLQIEKVEQRFRDLEFRSTADNFNFNYAQPSRISYGGSSYGYSNRKSYRGNRNKDFERGKRGEKMVWVIKVDNIGETEN